jgi:hypothetical protein
VAENYKYILEFNAKFEKPSNTMRGTPEDHFTNFLEVKHILLSEFNSELIHSEIV